MAGPSTARCQDAAAAGAQPQSAWLRQQGTIPNRCGRSSRGPAPIGAAAAAGDHSQSARPQQQGPTPHRRGCSSTGPAPVGMALAAGDHPQ